MLVKKRQDILKLIATDRQWLFLVSRIINLALGESRKVDSLLVKNNLIFILLFLLKALSRHLSYRESIYS